MGRKVSSVKVGFITGVPVMKVHHCRIKLSEDKNKRVKYFYKVNYICYSFYFVFSTIFNIVRISKVATILKK